MPTLSTCPATLSGRTQQLAWPPCGLCGPVQRVGFACKLTSRRPTSSHRPPSPCPARTRVTKEGGRTGKRGGGEGAAREETKKGRGRMIMPVLLTDRRPGQAHRAYWACPVSTNQAMMSGVEVFRFPRRCPQPSPEPHPTAQTLQHISVQLLPSLLPEVMQCNAMQGECNAGGVQCKAKGQLLIRELNSCTDRLRDGRGSISHLPGQLSNSVCPAAARRHPRHGQANAGPPTTPDSLGECMQVLGTQSNLPTLLLSIRLVHRRIMTTPSHASWPTTTTGNQQESTALPSCPVWNACLCGTGELDIAAGPATSAPASLTFLISRHFSHRGPSVPDLITARHQFYSSSVTSQNPHFRRRPHHIRDF